MSDVKIKFIKNSFKKHLTNSWKYVIINNVVRRWCSSVGRAADL